MADESAEFSAEREQVDERTDVVAARGEVDIATVPRLRELVGESLDANKQHVVLDLTEVPFIDSVAVDLLVKTNMEMRERGGRFVIVCTEPAIRRLMTTVGLDNILDLADTREEALAGA
jgi:anti-anti-sigma factor